MKCPKCENDGTGDYRISYVEVTTRLAEVSFLPDRTIEDVNVEEVGDDSTVLCAICNKCDFAAPLPVFDEYEPWEEVEKDEQGNYFIPDYSLRLDEFHLKGRLYFDNGGLGELYSRLYKIHKAERIEDLPEVRLSDNTVIKNAIAKKHAELFLGTKRQSL
jgi:hypothetical protein